MLKRLLADRAGATAVEYGLIAAGVSMAIVNVLRTIGANLSEALSLLQSAVH